MGTGIERSMGEATADAGNAGRRALHKEAWEVRVEMAPGLTCAKDGNILEER